MSGINDAPKMSKEEIAAHKARNYTAEDDNLSGMKLMPMPTGCEQCKRALAECKGLENPAMDGIHYFDGRWLCDSCLQEIGRREKGLE